MSRGPLGRLLGVKTNAEMDRPGGYYIYEIASSAEGATFTSKRGAAPQGYENQKNVSAESAVHFLHASWVSANRIALSTLVCKAI